MKKIIFDIIIFLGLLAIGLIVAIACYQESYITTLLHYHDGDVYSSYSVLPITAGTVIKGEIRAEYDNFASVKLRINTFNRMNTTHIVFRLREKGAKDWYAVNTYTIDRFVNGQLYPFGFPTIQDSKERVYEFEMSSIDGTNDNALGITSGYHTVASQYVFSKSELLGNKQLLVEFVKEKLLSTIGDVFSILYFGMFAVPALAWLASRVIHSERHLKYIYLALCAYLFAVFPYLPVDMNSNTVLFVAASGYFVGNLALVSAQTIYTVAIICLFDIPLSIALGNTLAANRLSTLVFFLITVGVIMSFKELNEKNPYV